MRNFKIVKSLRSIYTRVGSFFVSAIIGISTAVSIYLGFLQRHFTSYRYLACACMIAVTVTLLVGWINKRVLNPALRMLPRKISIFALIAALFLSLILLLNINLHQIYSLQPDFTLQIEFETENLPETENGIALHWIRTDQGYVPYTHISYDGVWERDANKVTVFPQGQSVKLVWKGKVGSNAEIAFRSTDFSQPVTISWNGTQKKYDLQDTNAHLYLIRDHFDVSWFYYIPFVLVFAISSTYGLFASLVVMGQWSGIRSDPHRKNNVSWLLYAIPMVAIWSICLLILFPAVISNDSYRLISQALQGGISDWQSAFYTLLLSISFKLVKSPAFVLGAQIIIFAVIAAWGFSLMEKNGVPKYVIWLLSFLMAIFPANLIFPATFWKDVPYAFSLLLLSIILLSIVQSEGKWGARHLNWVWLGLAAVFVSLLRHNGWPSALLSLMMLPIVFKKYWKYYLGSLVLASLLFFCLEGILFPQIGDSSENGGQSNLVFLHHIAAHINAGTTLTADEQTYLDQFLPLQEWEYDSCYVGNLSYSNRFERDIFLKSTAPNFKLTIDLFLRDPLVDIKHMLSAGELSYKFLNNECATKSLHGFWSWEQGEEHWVIPNDLGVSEYSLFPDLVTPLFNLLRKLGYFDGYVAFYIRPAFWLFLAWYALSVLVVRRKSLLFFIPIIPALVQSLVLFLIGFAPAYRYYYSNCLVGLFMIGCIFISRDTIP